MFPKTRRQELIEQRKPQFLEFISQVPGLRFVEFVEVENLSSTLTHQKIVGNIPMDKTNTEIANWMKGILESNHVKNVYIFTFAAKSDLGPQPVAKIDFGEAYNWLDTLYERGRGWFFLSVDRNFYLSIIPWEGSYQATIRTD